MTQQFKGISIEAIAACVPKNKISGDHFSDILDAKELRKFEKTTGIIERRYVDKDKTASDLGYIAAKKVLEQVTHPSEIKALVFVSQTSDYKIPFTSNILQEKLKLSSEILCLDVNAGCAGFIQGLSVSYALASTINGKVLFVISETLSKILSPKDKTTTTLFGDGGAALLISRDKLLNKKSYFNFFSDGNNYDAIIIPDGGYRNQVNKHSFITEEDENGNKKNKLHLSMDGPRVFDFTLREIPKSIESLFENFEIDKNEIDSFLFHQSNKFIIKQITSKLGVPKDKVPINIDKFGNTSGVSIPLLIVTELNKEKTYKKILLSGYGVGLNWGNCVISLTPNLKIFDLIEI
jgi:3-oxoacyl-[acyl-carrier-protein] synthase-3